MKLSKKVRDAVRKTVVEDFDHQGTVRDVYLRVTKDHYGDECIAVQLVVEPGASSKKIAKAMIHMSWPIMKCLSRNNVDLPFLFDFGRIEAKQDSTNS